MINNCKENASPTHQVYTVEIDSAIALNCTAHFETSSSIEVQITSICQNMITHEFPPSLKTTGESKLDMYESCEDWGNQ